MVARSSTRKSKFTSYLGLQAEPFIAPELLSELADVAILENQSCAKKVDLAATMFDVCVKQNALIDDLVDAANKYVSSEIALVLGCSKTVADGYINIGTDLRDRLPAIKAEFDAGGLDLARVRAIYRCTHNLTAKTAAAAEEEILLAAQRLSPGPLADEIWLIMFRIAPDEAEALRKALADLVSVKYRDKDVISTIAAELAAADAAASWQFINEVADTICPRDPRNIGQRRAAAYVAIMHQESSVACTCAAAIGEVVEGEDFVACTSNPVVPDRRAPLTMISVDLPTLAGLLSNPAHLSGHGTIDADYARELAADSHWQLILTEAIDLADSLGYRATLDSLIKTVPTSEAENSESCATTNTSDGGAADVSGDKTTESSCADGGGNDDSRASADDGDDDGRGADGTDDAGNDCGDGKDCSGDSGNVDEDEDDGKDDDWNDDGDGGGRGNDDGDGGGRGNDDGDGGGNDVGGRGNDDGDGGGRGNDDGDGGGRGNDDGDGGGRGNDDGDGGGNDVGGRGNDGEGNDDGGGNSGAGSDRQQTQPTHLGYRLLGRGRRREGGTVPQPRRQAPTESPSSCDTPGGSDVRTDKAGHAANSSDSTGSGECTTGIYRGTYTFIAQLESAIIADHSLGKGIYPDGHGGSTTPPRGALTYRPSATLAECIRQRDRTCRHPGCDTAAAHCDIDHIVPYLHRDPESGGWTIATNLHCLCRYHHTLKTHGLWTPVMLTGGIDYWKSQSGTTAITVPGNTIGADFASTGHSLVPKLPRAPKKKSTSPSPSTSRTTPTPTSRPTTPPPPSPDHAAQQNDSTTEPEADDDPAPF